MKGNEPYTFSGPKTAVINMAEKFGKTSDSEVLDAFLSNYENDIYISGSNYNESSAPQQIVIESPPLDNPNASRGILFLHTDIISKMTYLAITKIFLGKSTLPFFDAIKSFLLSPFQSAEVSSVNSDGYDVFTPASHDELSFFDIYSSGRFHIFSTEDVPMSPNPINSTSTSDAGDVLPAKESYSRSPTAPLSAPRSDNFDDHKSEVSDGSFSMTHKGTNPMRGIHTAASAQRRSLRSLGAPPVVDDTSSHNLDSETDGASLITPRQRQSQPRNTTTTSIDPKIRVYIDEKFRTGRPTSVTMTSRVPEPKIRYFGTNRVTMNTGRVVTKLAEI